MHKLKIAKYGNGRPDNIGMRCDDDLGRAVRIICSHLGWSRSQFIESITRDYVGSLQDSPDSQMAEKAVRFAQMIKAADADNRRSITEAIPILKIWFEIGYEWFRGFLDGLFGLLKTNKPA